MTLNRRQWMLGVPALGASPALWAQSDRAADYPRQSVRLVVPYAAGGGPDVLTRRVAEVMSARLGKTVFVENRVGAGGLVAAESVAQAAPDGYTLMLGASTHIVQKLISPQARFDPMTDFVHITRNSVSPSVLVVAADSPYRTIDDLVQDAKARPGKLNYASGGIGSAAHLAGAAMLTKAGLEVAHIPYRGSVEIVPSILSGDTQFGFPVISTALPLVAQKKVRVLAVTAAERYKHLADVPTLKEHFGSDELVLDAWSGLWAPAKTPRPIVEKLNAVCLQAMTDPGLRQAFEAAGSTVDTTDTPEAFTRFVQSETTKYARLVAAARISTK